MHAPLLLEECQLRGDRVVEHSLVLGVKLDYKLFFWFGVMLRETVVFNMFKLGHRLQFAYTFWRWSLAQSEFGERRRRLLLLIKSVERKLLFVVLLISEVHNQKAVVLVILLFQLVLSIQITLGISIQVLKRHVFFNCSIIWIIYLNNFERQRKHRWVQIVNFRSLDCSVAPRLLKANFETFNSLKWFIYLFDSFLSLGIVILVRRMRKHPLILLVLGQHVEFERVFDVTAIFVNFWECFEMRWNNDLLRSWDLLSFVYVICIFVW